MIGMNRVQGTREAVEAVLRSNVPFHLSLTNHGSTDGTAEYFDVVKQHYPGRVHVFHEDGNKFFQEPNARAFRLAHKLGCEYFVALNDDAIIPPEGLKMMMQVLDENPQGAISGPQGGCQQLNHDMHGEGGQRLDFIEGSCMCVKIAAVQRFKLNLWDENLTRIYSEDAFESLFMQEKGYSIHKVPFDLPHARSQTVNRTPETQRLCREAQAKNHLWMQKRFGYWLERRKFSFPIILKRNYALGDVLLLTPLIRAIKEAMPLCSVHVETDTPAIFDRNPLVDSASKTIEVMPDELTINLNMASEDRTLTHLAHSYLEEARKQLPGIPDITLKTDIYPSQEDYAFSGSLRNRVCRAEDRLLVVHAGRTDWPGKKWPDAKWVELVERFRDDGWTVASIGSAKVEHTVDWTNQTTLHQTAALLSFANLFIGMDSFPMHLATAVGCPTVGLFGVSSAKFVLTGNKRIGVQGTGANSGLRHRLKGKTFLSEGAEVMDTITVDQVMEAVKNVL